MPVFDITRPFCLLSQSRPAQPVSEVAAVIDQKLRASGLWK